MARIEEIELDFREVSLVGVRPVSRKDLDDAEQEASGEYRTPAGDLTVTSPWASDINNIAFGGSPPCEVVALSSIALDI